MTGKALLTLMACLGAVSLLPQACTPAETRGPEAPAVPATAPVDGHSFVVRHLAGKVDLVCPKATIRTALLEIARQRPDLHIAVDPDLMEYHILDAAVGDMNLRQIPVEEALRLTLAPNSELTFRVEPQRVLVTIEAKVLADLVTVAYPVEDILLRLGPDPDSGAPQFNLANTGYGPTAPQFNLANIGNNVAAPQFNLANIGNNVNLANVGNNVNVANVGAAPQFNLANIGNNVNVAGGSGGGLGGLFTVPANGGQTGGDPMAVIELITCIKQTVNAASDKDVAQWTDEGGQAEMTCKNGALWVKQTHEGQERVAALLAKLRASPATGRVPARATMAEIVRTETAEPVETLTVRRLLATPIDVDFKAAPLTDTLASAFAKVPALQWVLDPAIAGEGLDISTRLVTLRGKQITVRSVLDLTLSRDLVYEARPGYLLITTRARFLLMLPVEVYDVTELLTWMPVTQMLPDSQEVRENQLLGAAELVSILKQTVNATSDPYVAQWSDEGGPAVMLYIGGRLIVSQTREGQEQAAALLARFRASLATGRVPTGGAMAEIVRTETAEHEARLALRRLLETRIDVDFQRTPLSEALPAVLDKVPGLRWAIDPEIAGEGIDLDSRLVTLNGKQATVQSVLGRLLGPDIGYDVRQGCLLVTTRSRLQSKLPVELYDVTNLMQPVYAVLTLPDGRRMLEPLPIAGLDISVLLKETVNATSDPLVAQWSDEGGPAVMQFFGGRLIVSQTHRAHERIAELLGKLLEARKALIATMLDQRRGKNVPFTPPAFKSPEDEAMAEDKAVLAQLGQVVNFHLADKPLAEVIEMIRVAAPGLNVAVSNDVAAEGIDIDSRKVTLNAKNAPLRTVLDQALGDDLGWRVKDGWLEITTRGQLQNNLPVVLYPVYDIMVLAEAARGPGGERGTAPPDIVNYIKRTVNAESDRFVAQWSDEGGPAVMQFTDGVLIISQTSRGHQRIRERLIAYILRLTGGAEQKPAP